MGARLLPYLHFETRSETGWCCCCGNLVRKYDNSIEDVAGDVTDEYVKDGQWNIPTVDKCSPASCQIFFDVKVHANHAANHANHAESLNPVTVVHKSENREFAWNQPNNVELSCFFWEVGSGVISMAGKCYKWNVSIVMVSDWQCQTDLLQRVIPRPDWNLFRIRGGWAQSSKCMYIVQM